MKFKTIAWTVGAVALMTVTACCTAPKACCCLKDLPANADPALISKRVTDQFLRTRPESYCPPGYKGNGYCDKGYGGGRHVQYSVVSIWVNALETARQRGDKKTEDALIRLYDDFLPGGSKNSCCSRPYHVDDTIFGSIPYQIFLYTADPKYLAEGARYADTQWTPPCEGTVKERHAAPFDVQNAFWQKGYTPQTRLWIDDMYMIIAIQSQAYRATGDRKYIDRTAKEMCLYLDELQLKEGKAKGLFYHAPDVHYVWGRGDGWMAGGMTMVLKYLPEDSEYRPRIMQGYKLMMEALLKYQRPDGMWSQLVDMPDEPRNWAESSCTAMFAYAFITGVKKGWLCPKKYGPAARKAWIALCDQLDENANVPTVCCGTGKKDDLQYYFDRIRVHGDPHGQAPMLWCANALLEK
ncbi:MAG: glycoside hydrolase family 88 protein [Kiritimatiellae bacterium]|nr:glycoside hydrolase family 88 protein [Kiritimatiellia bacterium]